TPTLERTLKLLIRGRMSVHRNTSEGAIVVDELRPGDFFGEFELLTVVRTGAKVIAEEPSAVLHIPARVVEEIAEKRPEVVEILWDSYFQRSFNSILRSARLFNRMAQEDLNRVTVEIEPVVLQPGDIVLTSGERPDGLYGVVGGSLAVIHEEQRPPRILSRVGPGEFFGLTASSAPGHERATVVAVEDTTMLWLPSISLMTLESIVPALSTALRSSGRDSKWPYKLADAAP
ncbi:MAG: cyclic nucleotide-binding domain-containing protein, partial [Myxococcales bacterium]|nr:cyclic nucleotide-binding domain-containing protein [Myxococcales bacterium]